jgi:hypothetical protein
MEKRRKHSEWRSEESKAMQGGGARRERGWVCGARGCHRRHASLLSTTRDLTLYIYICIYIHSFAAGGGPLPAAPGHRRRRLGCAPPVRAPTTRACACVRACVRARMCLCACACACACVCMREHTMRVCVACLSTSPALLHACVACVACVPASTLRVWRVWHVWCVCLLLHR